MRNLRDVPASRNRSLKQKDSRSTSELKESHPNQYLKMKAEPRIFKKLAHIPETQSRTDALITDLQKTDAFNPLSEEAKRTIHKLGKVEVFDLSEVFAKTQCPSCAKYWPEGILYCICGQCLLPSGRRKRMTKNKRA